MSGTIVDAGDLTENNNNKKEISDQMELPVWWWKSIYK